MANGVWHTGYRIKIELTHVDLGHPERPGLMEEITQPVDQRERELLECLEHHERGVCQARDQDRSPWMTIRRRTVGGITTLVAAHLPVRTKPTEEESDKHKAMKERIARAAHRHGLSAVVEARSADGKVRNDVLVTGAAGRIGWEAQYSPITANTVRRRSQAAVERGITPLWVTQRDNADLIDRAPWVRVNDLHWKEIASSRHMLIRGGVRRLQAWFCQRSSVRACPINGSSCGRLHAMWELPDLCLPRKEGTGVDQLVVASANGEFVPLQVSDQRAGRGSTRMWVPSEERDRWHDLVGPDEEEPDDEDSDPGAELTFTEEALDSRCRYGEKPKAFNDPRRRRDGASALGLRTLDQVPDQAFRIPRQPTRLNITPQERRAAAALYGCPIWRIGPCAGCGTPIHRYGPGSAHACPPCRTRANRS